MTACFHNALGLMIGVDGHTYITIGPEGVPVPVLLTPHFVMGAFLGVTSTPEKRIDSITADGMPMIQRGFKLAGVLPHFPMTALPPHPAEAAQWAEIVLLSSAKAFLGVASVTGRGSSLAVCVGGPVGATGNCGPGVGLVVNPTSVVTSPTAEDYVAAALAFGVSAAFSFVVGEKIKKSKVLRELFKFAVGPYVEDWVREVVDHALE